MVGVGVLFAFLLLELIGGGAYCAEAKMLYVNGLTGNDTISYAANGASNPWRSLGRAAWGSTNRSSPNALEAARAGDTVFVAPGTYSTVGSNSRNDPAYNPVNSGTRGGAIIFQAQGTVLLTLSSSRGAVIGAFNKDYITWKGFTINEASAPSHADTGPVTFTNTMGSSAENLRLNGNGDPGYGDNHAGIRIDYSVNITVKNNVIRNFYTSGVNRVNGAGVQVYNSKGLTIEHNEIFDSGSGVYLKAIGFVGDTPTPSEYSDIQDVVRFNLIHDVEYGLVHHRHLHTAPTVYVLWYQNIVRNATLGGITVWGFPGDGPSNGQFVNNTIDGCVNGIYIKGAAISDAWSNLFQNNLITTSTNYAIFNETNDGGVSFELDRAAFVRNWYWSFPVFLGDGASYRTLSQFQGIYAGQESGGVTGVNPNYVNSTEYNFHLSPGSPAFTAGRAVHGIGGEDGETIPVGAYIRGVETIGLLPSSLVPPRIPSNLQFVPVP